MREEGWEGGREGEERGQHTCGIYRQVTVEGRGVTPELSTVLLVAINTNSSRSVSEGIHVV